MNGADYLFVGVIAISLVVGAIRGFVREVIALLAWLAGLWLSWRFAYVLYPYLGGSLGTPGLREWIARILMLVLVLLIGSGIGALVGYLMSRAAGLAVTDRLLGAVFGLVRAVVVLAAFVLVGQGLRLDSEGWWKSSRLMPYVAEAARWLDHYAEPAIKPLLDDARNLTYR